MKRIVLSGIATGVCILALLGNAFAFAADPVKWPFWDNYKIHFLTSDGRIVDWDKDECTTSEGQAYALFFALVANDRASFNSVLKWTETNLAEGNLENNLPAWLRKRTLDGQWAIADPNSASDADLWIAYTLIQAGRAWGEPRDLLLGRSMAQRIAAEEMIALPGNGFMLLPGRTGFHRQSNSFVANPSYLPLQILTALAREFPSGPWRAVANNLPALIAPDVGHGFAMDWVEFQNSSGFSASPGPSSRASGSYDAIRVYLWAGMLDPATPGREQLLESLTGMEIYMRAHVVPPESVAPSGDVFSSRGPIGFSAAVIPFLFAVGAKPALQSESERLRSEQVSATGLYGKDQRYYDQNLALFSDAWSKGLFQFDSQGQLRLRWKRV